MSCLRLGENACSSSAAALRAWSRRIPPPCAGHEVVLCEEQGKLGGILRTEAALPFKQDMYQLGVTYARLCEEAGVDIRLNTRVDAAFAECLAADACIVAVGVGGFEPACSRGECRPVLSIDDLYLDHAEVGEEVVVIGGGLTGCSVRSSRPTRVAAFTSSRCATDLPSTRTSAIVPSSSTR